MKSLSHLFVGFLMLTLIACEVDFALVVSGNDTIEVRKGQSKVTGDVEIIWTNHGNHENAQSQGNSVERRAFARIVAFAPNTSKEPKGSFNFEVLEGNQLHRTIEAEVYNVVVHTESGEAWVIAEVMSDTKACSDHGGSDGEHDPDDSCSGEDGEGCEGHDGGCTGEDGEHGGDGGDASGNRCRIGQFIAIYARDTGTPGCDGDMITWKWYRPGSPHLPDISHVEQWSPLCEKAILNGNLVVH